MSQFTRPLLAPVPLGLRSTPVGYQLPATMGGGTGTGAMTANLIYYAPIILPGALVDRAGIEVTTGAAGNCRLGLYSNSGGLPSQLIIDFGALDTTSIALVEASPTAFNMPHDWCWLAAVFDATPTMRVGSGSGFMVMPTTTPQSAVRALTVSNTYGAFAATAVAPTAGTSGGPLMWLRKS